MKHVLIIGGGPAGMEASAKLTQLGYTVTLVEQTEKLGGKLNQWDRLFPNGRIASDLLHDIYKNLNTDVQPVLNTTLSEIKREDNRFVATLSNGYIVVADAILVTTGFELFDAHRKEEYGYGIYDNVITSADLEWLFHNNQEIRTSSGKIPKRIGIIHCVGSRDEKAGNTYCSQVCCITAVKQAIELTEAIPGLEVFSFYMDLRMFGRHFEEIYKKAQIEHNVQFIRGRLSEAFENSDGSIMLKVEDTLLNKPLKLNVDMVVLMVGMEPSKTSRLLQEKLQISHNGDGFLTPYDPHYASAKTDVLGIFIAGACSGPKTMDATLNDARSAALQVADYLR